MKTHSLRSASLLCALLLVSACRFGGLGGSATELVDPRVDGGSTPDEGSPTDESVDPSESGDGDEGALGVVGGGDSADDGLDDGGIDEGSCSPATPVPGCDPVTGTNCTQGINQCVVDPDSPTAAGRCVFPSAALATGCDENGLYTTCPTGFTCKQGECRKYCYCDTDCDQDDTCSEPSGQGASDIFKLCANTRP
ncbi:MAG: hypothetical protein QM778_28180 [Myxococcales bacterium]